MFTLESRPRTPVRHAALCALVLCATGPVLAGDVGTGADHASVSLSLGAAVALAQDHAASLQARNDVVAAARSRQAAAGQLPDPQISVGVENLPVSGADAYSFTRDFMTMRRLGWMQDMPNAAKRLAQQDQAQALVAREQAMQSAERVSVQRETALAWLTLYHAERKRDAFKDIEQQNQLWLQTVDASISASRAIPADALMAREERLQLADRRDEIERDIAKARASLQRWIGQGADASLVEALPDWLQAGASPSETAQHAHQQLARHAELQVYEPMKRMAMADVQEARAEQSGDWGWEVAYSKRGPGYGDMVSFQLRFDLPLWQGTRQLPRLQAKEHEVARIEAEQTDALRSHTAEVEGQVAELTALSRSLDRLQGQGLLLAEQRAGLVLTSYQGGRADLAAVLSARRDLAEQRLRLIDLQAQRDALLARLHYVSDETESELP